MDDLMKSIWVVLVLIVLIPVLLFPLRQTIGLRFLEDIKKNAPVFLQENGFEVIGRQGFQTCLFQGSAVVWFTIKRDNYLYECAITKRRGEYQLYSLNIKNAVNISVQQ